MRDDDPDSPAPILACGHTWDGKELWDEMSVILKAEIEGPDGPAPAVSAGHHCRACRARMTGERFASLDEAHAWLRSARA